METRLLIFISCLFLILSCEKWDFDRAQFTQVITVGAIEVGTNEAFLIGDLENIRENVVIEQGFIISSSISDEQLLKVGAANILVSQVFQQDTITSDQAFAAKATGLARSTKYYFRAFAGLEGLEELIYGAIDTFQTTQISLASPLTECISPNRVRLNSNFLSQVSNLNPTELGFVWSNTNNLPLLAQDNQITVTESLINEGFSSEFDIPENQRFFLRAYAILGDGEAIYSDGVLAFSTTPGGEWIQSLDFPGERRFLGFSLSIENKGYFGFGSFDPRGILVCGGNFDDFWEFDPEKGWSLIGSSIVPRSVQSGFSLAGKGYIGLGCACNNVFTDFYEFDPLERSWTRLADAPVGFRRSAISFAAGDKGFIGAGKVYDANCTENCPTLCNPQISKQYFQFDPASTAESWSTKAFWDQDQFEEIGPIGPVVFSLGNKAYLGFSSSGSSFNDFWEFNPQTGWNKIAPFPDRFPGRFRQGATAFTIRDKAYVGLGYITSVGVLEDFYEFDPQQTDNPWKRIADFPGAARYASIGFSLNGRGFAGLGFDNFGNDAEAYLDMWEYLPQLCP